MQQIKQQRKKLEIDIIKENHDNQINHLIMTTICKDDLALKQPVKSEWRFEKFKNKIFKA